MRMMIKGGHVIDPGNLDEPVDIMIENGKIVGLFNSEDSGNTSGKAGPPIEVVDASGCIVIPGLIDMHVHLRDPGEEYKETIETGVKAAAAGGFTSICCMPNTNPTNDNKQVTNYIIHSAQKLNSVKVFPVASISKGLQGKELSEYGELKEAGAVAITDDGLPVSDAQLMRRALEYSNSIGLQVITHSEEPSLSDGVMNEGITATRMGLSGIPNAAESIMVMRDIALSELTETPIHIAHVSTKESVRSIRAAKADGIKITAETAPHYFTLTDEDVKLYNTHAKMNPPLRSENDKKAICQGLADGTIDVIATDHAPHSVLEKDVEFDNAANGIIGLETSLLLGLKLVNEGILSLAQLIEKMSKNPAKILNMECGVAVGNSADLTIFDQNQSFCYQSDFGFSKSKNTPFDDWEFKGKVMSTIVNGRLIFKS